MPEIKFQERISSVEHVTSVQDLGSALKYLGEKNGKMHTVVVVDLQGICSSCAIAETAELLQCCINI